MPNLNFHIEQGDILPNAAAPTLLFKLHVDTTTNEPISSIMLRIQLRILTAQRPYNTEEQARLWELFGEPARWSTTLRPLLWTQTIVLVPAFEGTTAVEVPIPCTYDFDVVSAKYFHALTEGEIPLEFLFSGTVFYLGTTGLQATQIPWDKDAEYRLPLGLWRALMDHYFPNSAWLRLRRDLFDQLSAYKINHGLTSWEAALESLLSSEETAPSIPVLAMGTTTWEPGP